MAARAAGNLSPRKDPAPNPPLVCLSKWAAQYFALYLIHESKLKEVLGLHGKSGGVP